MHEMETIVTDVHGVRLSVSLSVAWLNSAARAVCVCNAFAAAFAKLLWPLAHNLPKVQWLDLQK